MLAPISDLVGECEETKTTKKIKPRKSSEVGSDSSKGI
jgi:hypothetical protein